MPTTVEIQLFKYDELTPTAQEKAREWYRDLEMQDCDLSFVTEDFTEIAEMLGFDFSTHTVTLYGGGKRQEPNIYYSLSYSQGDGASFEGRYEFRKGFAKAVKTHAPQDTKLHAIVNELARIQKACGYRLSATITQSGNYTHARTMSAEVYQKDDRYMEESKPFADNLESDFQEVVYDLGDWLHDRLKEEYEFRLSDESITESLEANDYDFEADGSRAKHGN